MDGYQRELFKTLINRLRLPNSIKCFQGGTINKLIIHDRSNQWSFYVTLNSLMPYHIFQEFDQKIKRLFGKTTSIKVIFNTKDTTLHNDSVKAYWPWVVKNCGLSAIMAQQLKKYSHLKIVDNHVLLSTKNEALRGFLINGALVYIEDCYYQLGFPHFKIRILGGKRKLPAKIINFKIKKNANDIKLAKRAVHFLDNNSSK